jgi:mannose-6-phosphate isomerase
LTKTTTPRSSIEQPIEFDPIYKETIWGGRVLETLLGKPLPPLKNIGESWEISGCGNDQSIAKTADFMGKSLAWILANCGERLVGTNVKTTGDFPLLCKLIDAHDRLSVQVHPSDADAHANGLGPFGKTECWYIVHADPGAQIVAGLKKGVSKNDIAAAVQNTTLTDLLEFHAIATGDMLFIPAGTVHAICSSTVIYEVQQTSDVTFRLYDWGRLDGTGKSRSLHVRESLQVLSTQWHGSYAIAPLAVETLANVTRTMRIACRYFAMEEYHMAGPGALTLPVRNSFRAIMVLDGSLTTGGTQRVNLTKGQSALLPAAMTAPEIVCGSSARFLVSWVPDLRTDIIEPLKKLGIRNEAILALGGNPETNDLLNLF